MFMFSSHVGDEILAVNGTPLQGLSHAEAIAVFKSIRNGHVVVHAARRDTANRRYLPLSTLSQLYDFLACRAKRTRALLVSIFNLVLFIIVFYFFLSFGFAPAAPVVVGDPSKSKSCDELDRVE